MVTIKPSENFKKQARFLILILLVALRSSGFVNFKINNEITNPLRIGQDFLEINFIRSHDVYLHGTTKIKYIYS